MTKSTQPRKRMETLDDAAARWSVSSWTLRRMIARGQLTGYRLNSKLIRVDPFEVDALFHEIPTVALMTVCGRQFGGAEVGTTVEMGAVKEVGHVRLDEYTPNYADPTQAGRPDGDAA